VTNLLKFEAMLGIVLGPVDAAASMDQARQALAIAREVDDPALVARTLTACGVVAGYSAEVAWPYFAEVARPYFAEAIGLARALDDRWRLSQILAWQALGAVFAVDPIAARAAGEEGRDLADAIGDRFDSRFCRFCLGMAQLWQGDPAGAVAQFGAGVAEAEAAHDLVHKTDCLQGLSYALATQDEVSAARGAAVDDVGEFFVGLGYAALTNAALAAGDVEAAQDASEMAWQNLSVLPATAAFWRDYMAVAALAGGDLIAARRWADEAVTTATGWHLMQGEPEQAERDAYDALACAAEIEAYLFIPDIFECRAVLADKDGSHREAARLLGAAQAIRLRIGTVRFKIYDGGYEASLVALRDALGEKDFDSARAEGAALSTEEAIAYAKRGRGARKRPTSGWASLTPAELDVVRLVSEGLPNNDIATRLFVSPRTVQSHLTHVYTKLGLTSRVQLAQEAARRA
jgi:DNA-binding CsgD family transcriptional regulator